MEGVLHITGEQEIVLNDQDRTFPIRFRPHYQGSPTSGAMQLAELKFPRGGRPRTSGLTSVRLVRSFHLHRYGFPQNPATLTCFRRIQPSLMSFRFAGWGRSMAATGLFVKRAHGNSMEPVAKLDFSTEGIARNVGCSPLRQVLITSQPVSDGFRIQSGELRENISVTFPALYDLPSGTVVKIGEALIRLTFHCEPCKKISHLIDFDRIEHKRGYLGSFLNSGTIYIGDKFSVTDQRLESIPYAVKDRVRWFLDKGKASGAVTDLLHGLGLPSAYARALPRMIEKMGLRQN